MTDTRWYSLYGMVFSICQNEKELKKLAIDNPDVFTLPSTEEWTVLKSLLPILLVLMETTKILETRKQVVISKSIMLLENLKLSLENLPRTTNLAWTLKSHLLRLIAQNVRKEKYSGISLLTKAAFFDPGEDRKALLAKEEMIGLKKEYEEKQKLLNAITEKETETKPSNFFILFSAKDSFSVSEWDVYVGLPRVDWNCDTLAFWESKKKEFPILYVLSRKYLCFMPSSCLVEGSFKNSKGIDEYKRGKMKASTLELFHFMKENNSLMKPSYTENSLESTK